MLVAKRGLVGNVAAGSQGHGRRRGATGRDLLCFGVAAVIISAGVGVTSRAAVTVQSGYRIGLLKAQLAALSSENESLEVEVARLQSLSRVEEVARSRLGMAPPGDIRVARVDTEWHAATKMQAEEAEAALESQRKPSVFAFFTRLASGARTAQARPAR
ncbi:MAG: cell division protein FtsL [Ignavibacteriales bacterium]